MATPHDDTAPPSATDYPSEEELAEVDRLDREATPGPWAVFNQFGKLAIARPEHEWSTVDAIAGHYGVGRKEDAALIAAARTLLPRVVRALRAAASELSEARGAIEARDDLLKIYAEDVKKERDAYARGRREAVESSAAYIRKGRDAVLRTRSGPAGTMVADALDAAAEGIKKHERARGSK
jgi:hypothetical protein